MNNYIFPFLWMRDQDEATLRKEIQKIDECSIKAICLESRTHPDFGGSGWWKDFDIVIEEAKKRRMRIWILDDAHFPTGQANGIIPNKYPERARKYIMMQHTDCVGPVVKASLDVNVMMTKKFTWLDFGKTRNVPLINEPKLLSVTAVRLIEKDIIDNEIIDLTDKVVDGWLKWDVPAGVWRICVSFETYDFGARNDYINYIDEKSVDALIESIYKPHYQHYASEFGNTIAGFFSDEPGFYNVDNFDMEDSIGRKKMALPWCEELKDLMSNSLGDEWKTYLPLLWMTSEKEEKAVHLRSEYMEWVSHLYSKNFSQRIGAWCEAKGVEYIGHVIEDNNEHSRLGCGAGHYFRAMSGQHMAGIDTIGGQILPGNPYGARHGVAYIGDSHFYHFALGKLGASSAQIDPKKKGRLMCEAFGAYGWNFGVKSMKWLVDFLLVQGVNHFVPHAFSMGDYPDDDCPPHFYARGNNPQFTYFAELMKYTNCMCDLLNNGKNVPVVAVLYPGEHDWMNECMYVQEPGQVLTEHQIDYEIIPIDALRDKDYFGTKIEEGHLIINERCMDILIIPESKYLHFSVAQFIEEALGKGLKIIFINSHPKTIIGLDDNQKEYMENIINACEVIGLHQLTEYLHSLEIYDIKALTRCKNLTYYHYKKEEDIYLLFNTSLWETVETEVIFREDKTFVQYNVMNKNKKIVKQRKDNGRTIIPIKLAPYESIVLTTSELEYLEEDIDVLDSKEINVKQIDISNDWYFSKVRSIDYPNFEKQNLINTLQSVAEFEPEFSGIMQYKKVIEWDDLAQRVIFEAQFIYEAAEVFVNGISAGKQLTPSYEWEITDLLQKGENTIIVEVVTTPTRDTLKNPGIFGPDREILESSGMFGKVMIKYI